MKGVSDAWARWLLQERFGGSEELYRQGMASLEPIRDRVLDGAELDRESVVLDVGCGDGLLGFAALDRTAPDGRVIFSDVSEVLVDECRRLAAASDASRRCDFLVSALPQLSEIPDEAADAVVLRSVLIYVHDKPLAFEHLHRALRPGGRLSLFEPINNFGFPEPSGVLWGFDVSGLEPLAEQVLAAAAKYQPRDNPMLGFDERDLLRWGEQAGFDDLRLNYEARVRRSHPATGHSIETFLNVSPNPTVPSRRQILEEALGAVDRRRLEQHLGEQLAANAGRTREAVAFLTARRT